MAGYTYIVTNKRYGVLYIGVTNDLTRRMSEHKAEQIKGFTQKYKCNKLVWFDQFNRIEEAIDCEKRMKKWERMWKIALIEKVNPSWCDLSIEWFLGPEVPAFAGMTNFYRGIRQ
jgi:putative endonuclease